MKNAFETLGIEARLAIDAEFLDAAFREAGKQFHPDAGGGKEEFALLAWAYETVSSPSRRLSHWLELRGVFPGKRGVVDPRLMDLFSGVGEATMQAEALLRKREHAKSALGLAMLEREAHLCRERVSAVLAQVEQAIVNECGVLPVIENADAVDVEEVSAVARNLAFLEKWRAGLRGLFARLV